MTGTCTKQQLLDIKTDMKLLLECMNYQKDNPSALKQALVTLSSSLQSCNEARDIFRDMGGLQSVLDTVTSTRYREVTEAGLYCLGSAVERNVYSQKLLSTASTFTFLHGILQDEDSSVRKKRTAAFLLLCLVSNNGFGQNLARESSCLNDIVALIRTCLPGSSTNSPDWGDRQEGKSVALWSALVSTACVCVNNPLNEENQRICATLLPFLFRLLQQETSRKITTPILSLIGLTVSNNAQNQDRVRKCGGLEIFVRLLKKLVAKRDTDFDSKTTAVHFLNTLDSCIADNEENSRLVGKLGAIPLMLKMLSEETLEDKDKTQIVLTLAHAADVYDENKNYIKDSGGITSLIQQLTLTENEELSKTVKYLLQMCITGDKERAADLDENNNIPDDGNMVGLMEKIKRQNDLQMLEKINELDEKLRSMEKDVSQRQESVTQQTASLLPVKVAGSNMTTRSEKSLSKREGLNDQETPMTPREKSLLAQLDREKKEKERLEALNQMMQENMHFCLTRVVAKEHCSKSDSCENSSEGKKRLTAPTELVGPRKKPNPSGDASHLMEKSGGENGPTGFQVITEPVDLSVRNDANSNCVLKEVVMPCSSDRICTLSNKDYSYQPGSQRQNVSNIAFGDSHSTDSSYNQNSVNTCPIQSQTRNSEYFSAVPLYTQQCSKNFHPTPGQSGSQITCAPTSSKTNTKHANTVSLSNHRCEQQNKQKNNNTAIYSSVNSLRTKNISGCSNGSIEAHNDGALHMQSPVPYVRVERLSVTPDMRISVNKPQSELCFERVDKSKIISNITPNVSQILNDRNDKEVCPNSATGKVKAKRVLLEYTKAVSKGTLTTPSLSQIVKDDAESNYFNSNSAVPKIAKGKSAIKQTADKNTETETVKQIMNKATEKVHIEINTMKKTANKNIETENVKQMNTEKEKVPNESNTIKQTANKNTETENVIQIINKTTEKEKAQKQGTATEKCESMEKSQSKFILNPPESSEKYPQNQLMSKTNSEPFKKPNAPPPRRKVRMTPKLGSGKITETLHGKTKTVNSVSHDAGQSDVESEFDFELHKTAKENKLRQTNKTSCNDSASNSVISKRGISSKTVSELNALNRSKISVQNRCSEWSVIPVTPTKKTVLPRPAFSDCGSRRPVFDSPVSVKSVGRIQKRILDDSGIHSPENGFNTSPGVSSLRGSSDSQSDLSSYFNDYTGDDYVQMDRRKVNQKKQITVFKKQDKCPGCQAPAQLCGQILNSRTFNIVLETDPNTCSFHRKLRQCERIYIHQTKKRTKRSGHRLLDSLKSRIQRQEKRKRADRSEYEFESNVGDQVSPASLSSDEEGQSHYPTRHKKRRQRLEYTEDEERNLLEGVRKMGKSWTKILLTYKFHPSRTAVDLKDKYKSMMKSAETRSTVTTYSTRSRTLKPFSMCEERRLRRGIRKFGYSWKTILEQFTFSRDRTAEDLRNRWRSMHRRGGTKTSY